jgi:hypothetical protein
MIYDFKREKDLRELQKTNDYPERPHLDAILDVRAKAEQLMREFVGEPDVPAEPGCWLVVGRSAKNHADRAQANPLMVCRKWQRLRDRRGRLGVDPDGHRQRPAMP